VSGIVDTLRQLGPSRLGVMGAILVGLLAFFVFISVRVSTPDMKMLYRDLSTTDASAISAKLEENAIPYQVSPDGGRIVVAEDQVGRARMLLAEAGLPNGGNLGYELFDKQSSFGTTNFVQNVNQVRALEGELARTITSVASIRSARVHLVLPQRELFSRERKTASASVFLGLQPGMQLEREQILAIQSLVASSVEDLSVSNVSIVDNHGNLLARGGEEEENLMSMKAEELRRSYESRLTRKIEDQVGRVVGFGNVRATVTAEINFDRISTNEELFDPEMQVVRSSQVTEENSSERESLEGDVSVGNNLPGVEGGLLENNAPSAQNNRIEEVTNYEIGKTIRSTVREVGEIKRLSVAVLVDGEYVEVQAEEGEDVAPTKTREYRERSQDELDQIAALVRSAVGFDAGRGDTLEVVNMRFAKVDTDEEIALSDQLFGFEKNQLLDVAQFIIVGLMIILVILLIIQPMVNKLLEAEERSIDDELEAELLAAPPVSAALEAPEEDPEPELMIDVDGVEGRVKQSAIGKVAEVIENHPNETVAVLRSWMSSDE
jgi:flagellar M-ring protein FliF